MAAKMKEAKNKVDNRDRKSGQKQEVTKQEKKINAHEITLQI